MNVTKKFKTTGGDLPVYTSNSSIIDILLSHNAHLFLHAVFMFMINYIKETKLFFNISQCFLLSHHIRDN